MSDKDKRPDRPDYDLTSPNIYPARGEQPRRPAAPDERTTINNPVRPTTEMPSSRPAPTHGNKYDLTSVNVHVPSSYDDEDARARDRQPPRQAPQPPVAHAHAVKPRGRVPAWVWVVLGASLLLLVACGALLAYLFLATPQTFTLRVLDAPAGQVFVDDVPSGVRQRDGSIVIQGLRANEARNVSVRQEGFAEWKTTVTGKGGEVLNVRARMTAVAAPKPSLPAEIDYGGKMVLVSAGEFVMGADEDGGNASPAHNVTLPDFYIDKYEVTNEQYARFCKETGHAPPVNPAPMPNYYEENPRKPVMGVSYDDAVAYANWAAKRLPTEEEWEKAASWDPSAKSKRKWPWGDAEEKARANIGTEGPSDVGQYANGASAYGAQDMAGNVVEWVDAVYAPYPGSGYADKDYGKGLRVYRGGSFPEDLDGGRNSMLKARTTERVAKAGTFKTTEETKARPSVVGFRCAISASDPRLKPYLGMK
ncbi:MAG TPA: SUMF1/EgtB/PvdO family nonheme iron enzyme [Pyrinomonadaceae bacterium]